MIRIDLRYLMPIVAFYLPPLMFMTLGWMVGHLTADMREVIVFGGGLIGSVFTVATGLFYSGEAHGPQWFYIRRGEGMTDPLDDPRVEALVDLIKRAKHNIPEYYTLWHRDARAALSALEENK